MRAISPRTFLLFALVLALAACRGQHRRDYAEIQASGELTWGADKQGGEPYLYEDPADRSRMIGFEVDIMDAIARRLGLRARLVQTAWIAMVPSLERGDFDVAMNGLEATAARDERLRLSRPYYVYAETLAVRTGAPYRSLADLKGKRVGTLDQTYAHDLLRDAEVELRLYDDNEVPYLDLVAGRLDAVLLDNIIADRYGCDRAGVTCLPGDVARGTYVIGIRKDDPALQAAIDGALAAMTADGELERILRKHRLWDHRQTEPAPPVPPPPKNLDRHFGLEQLGEFAWAALITLALSCASFLLLAIPLGLLLALGRIYGDPLVRGVCRGYIELFRGTPVLLQLYVLYYGLGPYYALTAFQAAVLALGLNYAAYECEVYRGAILAIPRGQSEAARALGLGPWQALWYVILPQSFRLALPAMTNDFIALLKDSALVGAIAVIELTKQMQITGAELRSWLLPGLVCAAFYLALSLPLAELARRMERRLARDQRPHAL